MDGQPDELTRKERAASTDAQGVRDAQQQDGDAQVAHTVLGLAGHTQLSEHTTTIHTRDL